MPPKKKGDASLTMPGELDFTTKASSKDFDRKGKRTKKAEGETKDSEPFEKDKPKAKGKKMRKLSEEEKELIRKLIVKKSLNKSESARLRMKAMRTEGPLDAKAINNLSK